MSLPFTIIEGPVFIIDSDGNIIDSAEINSKRHLLTKSVIQGGNSPYYSADVQYINGVHRLATTGIVQIEQLFGFDPFPDNYLTIENTGGIGDTWQTQMVATAGDPTTPDRDAPAINVTSTVTATEVGDEIKLRDLIISDLNNDTNFKASCKAQAVKDLAIVHIYSKFRG